MLWERSIFPIKVVLFVPIAKTAICRQYFEDLKFEVYAHFNQQDLQKNTSAVCKTKVIFR